MARNNVKLFVDSSYFIRLDTVGMNNNIITIGNFEYGEVSNKTSINEVFCSFRGVQLTQTTEDQLDVLGAVDHFAYTTPSNGKNYIMIAVDKGIVNNVDEAKKYIEGMLVDYKLAQLSTAGNGRESLYEVCTYLSDGTLVSPTVACTLEDAFRKIRALDTNFNLNEVGYYKHVVQPALFYK